MSTTTIPARFMPHLHTAAVQALAIEAERVRDAEWDVWRAEDGPPDKLAVAQTDLQGVRRCLDRMIPLAQAVLAEPPDKDAELEDDPEATFYLLHVMAGKVLGPRVNEEIGYLPVSDRLAPLAEAMAWAGTESRRLEALAVRGADA